MAAAKAQRRLDGLLLVLETVAGQVQMQPWPPYLLDLRRDEAKPDLRLVTQYQSGAGLSMTTSRSSSPAQKAAAADAAATSKVTASSRRATATISRSPLVMTTALRPVIRCRNPIRPRPEFQAAPLTPTARRKPNPHRDALPVIGPPTKPS